MLPGKEPVKFIIERFYTERYGVSLRNQSECGKIRTRKYSIFGHFSGSVLFQNSEAPLNQNATLREPSRNRINCFWQCY